MDIAALYPPPLPPESKPKTDWRSLIANGLIYAAAGAAATWLVTRHLDLDGLAALGLFAVFLVSIWLHLLIHEAGHAIAGIAVGFKPVALGVGPLRLERGERSWHLRWGGGIAGIGGFAMLLPPADAVPRRREQVLYLLGGPLSNLVVSVPVLLLANAAPPGAWTIVGVGFGAAGVMLGLVNLVPFKTAGWLSDGANLLLLRRDPEGTLDGLRVQQLIQASMNGQRPRDWSAQLLPAAPLSAPASASTVAVTAALLRMARAEDAGDRAEAEACATLLAAHWPHSEAPLRPGIAMAMTSFALVVLDDVALAKAWRPHGADGLLDEAAHEAWLDAEIAVREGRDEEARERLAAAREALPRVLDGGSRVVIAEFLDRLEVRLGAPAAGWGVKQA